MYENRVTKQVLDAAFVCSVHLNVARLETRMLIWLQTFEYTGISPNCAEVAVTGNLYDKGKVHLVIHVMYRSS